jgi:hypothetical protein
MNKYLIVSPETSDGEFLVSISLTLDAQDFAFSRYLTAEEVGQISGGN